MLNSLLLLARRSGRRWLYAFLSITVALGLIVGSSHPTQAISIRDLIRGGIQVIQGVQIGNMSNEQEVDFGRQIDRRLRSREIRLYRDPEINAYIDQIGQRLAANSERPNIPYTFQIVNDKSINAFATAGGFVYVNTGLIAEADNEAQLASVIAHEIGHIAHRHVLKSIQKAALEQGLASAAGLDRNTAIGLGVQLGLRLPRSREYEYQADESGLKTLTKAGYAPIGMTGFLEKLLNKRGSVPTFLSTHPNTKDRIEAINRMIEPTTANQGDGLDSAAYKAKIQKLLQR